MKPAVKAAVCGVFTALSVVMMFIGGIISIFSYIVPMLLGVLMIMLKHTFGRNSAIFVYIASSFLSLLFVPDKETVLLYFMFFGYYPIVKSVIERIKPKVISILIKFLMFNLSVLAIEVICVFVFGIPFFDDGKFSYPLIISFAVLMNFIFVVYEYVLKMYLLLYVNKFEKRIKRFFKK